MYGKVEDAFFFMINVWPCAEILPCIPVHQKLARAQRSMCQKCNLFFYSKISEKHSLYVLRTSYTKSLMIARKGFMNEREKHFSHSPHSPHGLHSLEKSLNFRGRP